MAMIVENDTVSFAQANLHNPYQDMTRVDCDPEWRQIGVTCSAGRRSMWVKLHLRNPDGLRDATNVEAFELRAGREGDDAHVKIFNRPPGETSAFFCIMIEILTAILFAAET